jgi:ABC-2 type transport system permease protein
LSRPIGPGRLAYLHIRLGVQQELQYRANFWVQVVNSAIALGVGIVAIAVVYLHTDSLAGWSPDELVTVLGVHLMVGGFLRAFVFPNMYKLMSDVEEGTLDYTLTRPADSQLLVSVREVELWSLIDVVSGAGVLVWAVSRLGDQVGVIHYLAFLVALICGSVILYCLWIVAATLAFKVVRVDNVMQMLSGIYDAGRWPVGVYPFWLRGGLTYLVPLAFAITVPAETISGRIDWPWLLVAVGFTVVAFVVARLVWLWGIRNYSGASA